MIASVSLADQEYMHFVSWVGVTSPDARAAVWVRREVAGSQLQAYLRGHTGPETGCVIL